jgi:hypothetical protein
LTAEMNHQPRDWWRWQIRDWWCPFFVQLTIHATFLHVQSMVWSSGANEPLFSAELSTKGELDMIIPVILIISSKGKHCYARHLYKCVINRNLIHVRNALANASVRMMKRGSPKSSGIVSASCNYRQKFCDSCNTFSRCDTCNCKKKKKFSFSLRSWLNFRLVIQLIFLFVKSYSTYQCSLFELPLLTKRSLVSCQSILIQDKFVSRPRNQILEDVIHS